MTRWTILFLFVLVPCCAPPSGQPPAAASAGASPVACRSAPGNLAVERGIGGTGITPAGQSTAERGIGGTGIAPDGRHSAMRSVGGTDIDIGIVTSGQHPPPCR